ncbi:MAG: hypothetical protein EG826_06400 [Deltaproteobacteria bacterium]|nr:hypothetical protein [Deltaproteobacteria bacterium]
MKFSIYSPEQEEKIYIRREAGTWKRSGLISEDQFGSIKDAADPGLQQTNLFFRILFFVFTLLGAGAVVGLLIWLTGNRLGDKGIAALVLLFSLACFILAESIVKARRLYRYGIEEALLMAAMVCFVISVSVLIGVRHWNHQVVATVCSLFAVIAGLIYLRFGYSYAAMISIAALSLIPFQFRLAPDAERLLLLLILSGLFIFNLAFDKPVSEDFRKRRCAVMQAFLLIAIYLTVNLELAGLIGLITRETHIIYLHPKSYPPYLYWSSYVLSFIIPAAGIAWGIKSRKRLILNISLIMAVATLATNKSYLGMTRWAWDPAILGLVLIALSLGISRWLGRGPEKARRGFTAEEILKPADHGVGWADAASALTPGIIGAGQPPQAAPDKFYESGASGGGGAERKF